MVTGPRPRTERYIGFDIISLGVVLSTKWFLHQRLKPSGPTALTYLRMYSDAQDLLEAGAMATSLHGPLFRVLLGPFAELWHAVLRAGSEVTPRKYHFFPDASDITTYKYQKLAFTEEVQVRIPSLMRSLHLTDRDSPVN